MNLTTTADRIGAKAGLDPLVIIAIIQALTSLISLCVSPNPTPEQILNAAKYPRRRQRRAMKNVVKRELDARGQCSKYAATMAAIDSEIAATTPGVIAAICFECGQITADYDG